MQNENLINKKIVSVNCKKKITTKEYQHGNFWPKRLREWKWKKWKWRDIRRPILVICALHLSHPKCTHTAVNTHTPWTHTAVNTHTPWTHTRSSGQPGNSWGFGVLLKTTSVVVLRVKRALYIHSLHLQFLPARYSNSQPFDYESDSLTIRPRLPQMANDKIDVESILLPYYKRNIKKIHSPEGEMPSQIHTLVFFY